MKKKCIFAAMSAVIALALCSGCGLEESIVIQKNLSSKVSVKYYTTSQEEAAISKELDGMSYGQLMKEAGFAYLGKEEVNGAEHNVYQVVQKMSRADTKDTFAALNGHQAVLGVSDVGELLDGLMEEGDYPGGLDFKNIGYMALTVRYPFPVYKTNGKLQPDGYTVQYSTQDIRSSERLYAVDSKKVADARKCTISGVRNKGCYRKIKSVKVSSEGVITSFTVDGESWPYNEYDVMTEGAHKIKVKLLSGSSKTLQFVIDRTKPTTNVKAKAYKGKVKIKFQDKTSGIKQAALNGKKIRNGTVVSQKGNYVLKITDKAGNVKSVKFSVE